jgi:hypothetical protein
MEWIVILAVAAGIAIFLVLVSRGQGRDRVRLEALREASEAQFKSLVVEAADERYCFSGATAVVVDEVERFSGSEHQIDDAWLVRFCRNPHGEYFQFVSNSSRGPDIKHVPHNLARIALKNKYIAPESLEG